jgi:hypothetical protein
MNDFFRHTGFLFQRNRRRHELEDEMAFHREMSGRTGRPEEHRNLGNRSTLHEQMG